MRALVLVFVVAFLSWLAAAVAVLYAERQSAHERALLVRVICESLLIREEARDPLAPLFRTRYNAILAEAGESCPTRKELR